MRNVLDRPCPGRTSPFLSRVFTAALLTACLGAAVFAPEAWAKKQPKDQPAQAEPATAQSLAAAAQPACSPKKILIVGDSFAVGLGMTLEQSLKPRGPVALASKGKVSSGLNSPKF